MSAVSAVGGTKDDGPIAGSGRTYVVITTCSASKRCRVSARADDLPTGSLRRVADVWAETLRKEVDLTPAGDLYRGRAFATAKAAAGMIGADLGVVSAGLGFVREDTRIPSYDLTVRNDGPASVSRRIVGPFDARTWFEAISSGPFATDVLGLLKARDRVLVCLSRSYADMFGGILEKALEAGIDLRIFGLSLERHLPEGLRPHLMPYDERLARVGMAGTRVDFPQRALHHYVSNVLGATDGALVEDRRVVGEAMVAAGDPLPARIRNSVPDATIYGAISDLLEGGGPGRVRMLATLRSEMGVSCEQARFSRLYDEVVGARR